MIDRLFMNLVEAANKANHNPKQVSAEKTAYVLRKYERLVTPPALNRRYACGGSGSVYSRRRKGVAMAAQYDRQHKLSDSYYNRDTSHWAGR